MREYGTAGLIDNEAITARDLRSPDLAAAPSELRLLARIGFRYHPT
jgi:hypothetical protein